MWFFKVRECTHSEQFIAWCAKTAYLGNSPMDIPAHEEVHFDFGATPEEALSKLKREVLN
jgi:hypothetical protein